MFKGVEFYFLAQYKHMIAQYIVNAPVCNNKMWAWNAYELHQISLDECTETNLLVLKQTKRLNSSW